MEGEPRLSSRKPGYLLKAKGIMGKHHIPLWEIAIALGLVLYQLGLSFRKRAKALGLLGKGVSHVAVWYWNRRVGKEGIKLHRGPLPQVIVVDETWVGPGSPHSPRTLKVVYLEPFFMEDEGNTNAFLEHLVEAYGKWLKHMITDGGPWYKAAFSFWQVEGKIGDRGVLRGVPQAVDQGPRPLFPHKERLR